MIWPIRTLKRLITCVLDQTMDEPACLKLACDVVAILCVESHYCQISIDTLSDMS